MGGIVKSIGKAIKGIGKALKKIAPILLVAAAVYIGYGYMTGFQAGGWPQITNWGKSLVSGVGQGQTISQAATAASDMTAMAGAQTAALGAETTALGAEAVTTALPATEAVTSTAIGLDGAATGIGLDSASTGMIGQAGADVASAGMIDGMGAGAMTGPETNWALDSIAQTQTGINSMYQDFGAGWTDTTKGILADLNAPSPISSAQAAGMGSEYGVPLYTQPPGSTFVPELGGTSPAYPGVAESTSLSGVTDVASVNQAAANQVMGGVPTAPSQATVPYGGRNPYGFRADQYGGMSHLDPSQKGTFFGKLAQLGRKGWEAYKKMWAENPGMAMWTTSNVLKTILAMLDDTDEKLAYRRAHVGGFAPGGYDEVAARYGGNLPGGRGGGAGYTAPSRRSMQIKSGPIPEANRGRSSAVNRTPATQIRSTQQGQV
jgi:hypothetical protein